MTIQELIDYYANLLILQYLGKPKAYATIQTLVTPVIMDQDPSTGVALPVAVQDAFNVTGDSPAEGVQLDVIGDYAGVTRYGYVLGQPITLNDTDFLTLIQLAIIKNGSGSSLYDIQTLLHQFFPNEVLVFDYQNMQMSYLVSTAIGSLDLVELAIANGLLPKPMGVELASVIYAPVVITFFGFRTYVLPGYNVTPFNSYTDYQTDWPWVSYANAVLT